MMLMVPIGPRMQDASHFQSAGVVRGQDFCSRNQSRLQSEFYPVFFFLSPVHTAIKKIKDFHPALASSSASATQLSHLSA